MPAQTQGRWQKSRQDLRVCFTINGQLLLSFRQAAIARAMHPVTHTHHDVPDLAPTAKRLVRMLPRDLDAAQTLPPHAHPWGQLTYAVEGVVRLRAGSSSWIVPPFRAVWIPPNVEHELVTLERASLRVLYVYPARSPLPAAHCEVVDVSPLLRELIVSLSRLASAGSRESLLSALILDELAAAPRLPMRIALPIDKRLKALCERLMDSPGSSATLNQWARQVGASERTLTRLFARELGMSFGQWRHQLRLAYAVPLIARGWPLSRVAAEVGYASQSAFSAMFKKTFAESPSAFFGKKRKSAAKSVSARS